MTPKEFEDLRQAYEAESIEAAVKRHEAARLEIERSAKVRLRAAELEAEGRSKTAADKEAHSETWHREYQVQVATLSHEANVAEARARSTWLALRFEIAALEAAPREAVAA